MAHPAAADKGASIVGDGSSVRGDVDLGDGVRIGRGCIIKGRIRIGDRARIDDYCVVRGLVTMEAGNWIYPFCTIGTGPQHTGHPEDPAADPAEDPGRGEIVMGSDNTVRGYASVNLPTVTARTVVGSGCHLLAYSHVAHDCTVHDGPSYRRAPSWEVTRTSAQAPTSGSARWCTRVRGSAGSPWSACAVQ